MVALADFCKGYARNENLIKDIVTGVQNTRREREKAKQDFKAFCELFPYLPDKYEPKVLWKAWGGNKEALRKIYGESTPPPDVTEMDIGMYLCNYNIAKGKELEK